MINPTKEAEITMPASIPPFIWSTYEYHKANFYVTTGSLNAMYIHKYDVNDWVSMPHSFKVVIL